MKGKTLKQAGQKIRQRKCRVARVTRRFSARVLKGRVVKQRPRPGARRRVNSGVNLVLNRAARRAALPAGQRLTRLTP